MQSAILVGGVHSKEEVMGKGLNYEKMKDSASIHTKGEVLKDGSPGVILLLL